MDYWLSFKVLFQRDLDEEYTDRDPMTDWSGSTVAAAAPCNVLPWCSMAVIAMVVVVVAYGVTTAIKPDDNATPRLVIIGESDPAISCTQLSMDEWMDGWESVNLA